MANKTGIIKPFSIETLADDQGRVSDISVEKWQGNLLANMLRHDDWVKFVPPGDSAAWRGKKVANRGYVGDGAAAKGRHLDAMLKYIAQFAPNCLYRDITERAITLVQIWNTVKDWAGVKSKGNFHQQYSEVRRSFKANPGETAVNFYYKLRNAQEDCLLLSAASGGQIRYKGVIPAEDEEMSSTLESGVVLDWMEAVGGPELVNHVYRVFASELQQNSLADLRKRISDNLETLKAEASQASQAEISKINVGRLQISRPPYRQNQGRNSFRQPQSPQLYSQSQRQQFRPQRGRNPFSQPPPPPFPPPFRPNQPFSSEKRRPVQDPCKLCIVANPQWAASHSIADCRSLSKADRQSIVRSTGVHFEDEDNEEENHALLEIKQEEYDYGLTPLPNYDDHHTAFDFGQAADYQFDMDDYTQNAATARLVHTIRGVDVLDSPIFAVSHNNETIYVVLDYGATSNLITLAKAKKLGLQVNKTTHTAVMVDGQSPLEVVGEVLLLFIEFQNLSCVPIKCMLHY